MQRVATGDCGAGQGVCLEQQVGGLRNAAGAAAKGLRWRFAHAGSARSAYPKLPHNDLRKRMRTVTTSLDLRTQTRPHAHALTSISDRKVYMILDGL